MMMAAKIHPMSEMGTRMVTGAQARMQTLLPRLLTMTLGIQRTRMKTGEVPGFTLRIRTTL